MLQNSILLLLNNKYCLFFKNYFRKDLFWFGIDAGIIIGKQTNEIGFKGDAFRINMFTEINNGIGLSIGTIRDAKKTSVPIIGIRFPF